MGAPQSSQHISSSAGYQHMMSMGQHMGHGPGGHQVVMSGHSEEAARQAQGMMQSGAYLQQQPLHHPHMGMQPQYPQSNLFQFQAN